MGMKSLKQCTHSSDCTGDITYWEQEVLVETILNHSSLTPPPFHQNTTLERRHHMNDTSHLSTEDRERLENLLSSGLSMATRGNITAAEDIFSKIPESQLQHANDFQRAGTLASFVGKHAAATRLLEIATEMEPGNHALWTELARVCCNAGHLDQGIDAYEKARSIKPDAILPGLAQVYDVLGMHKQADNEITRIAKKRFGKHLDKKPRSTPPALVFAFLPKSAGTSLCRAIQQCTGISQGGTIARTDSEHFPNAHIIPEAFHYAVNHPVQLHTHIRATKWNLNILNESGLERIPIHVRDPRQAFVSYYFHSRNAIALARNRSANPEFDTLDEQKRFRWFMDFYYPRFVSWISEWVTVENNISRYGFSLHITSFEEMLERGQTELVKDICSFCDVTLENHSDEQNHRFRKGLVDEWRSIIPGTYHALLTDKIPAALMERFGWTY